MIKESNKVVSIVVNKKLLDQVDEYCDKMNIKRTALFNIAVSQYMQANQIIDAIYEKTKGEIKSV